MFDSFSELPDEEQAPEALKPEVEKLLKKPPKLAKLGMGSPVLKMKDEGKSVSEIANTLEVPEKDVKEMVQALEKIPQESMELVDHSLRSTSVFAVFDRLEDLFEDTMKMSRVAEDNPLLYKDYLNTRLNVLKLVKECQKDEMVTKQRDDEFNAIIEEIGKESLDCQQRIMKRIQQLRAARGLIKGF